MSYVAGIASLQSFAKIRWANLLRPVALINPSAAVGIAVASHMFNVYVGKVAMGAYSIMPFLVLLAF